MDSLHLAVAFVPLGLYLIALGAIHLRGRPLVLSGSADVSMLAVGLVGFLIAGPLELFFPSAPAFPGPLVWAAMLLAYGLLTTLWNLLSRPRLVVYNLTAEQLRAILTEIAVRVDGQARWAADSLVFEQLGVQFHVDPYLPMRTVSLVANGNRQSEVGWRRLRFELAAAMKQIQRVEHQQGYVLLAVGLAMFCVPLYELAKLGGATIAQRVADMLRL